MCIIFCSYYRYGCVSVGLTKRWRRIQTHIRNYWPVRQMQVYWTQLILVYFRIYMYMYKIKNFYHVRIEVLNLIPEIVKENKWKHFTSDFLEHNQGGCRKYIQTVIFSIFYIINQGTKKWFCSAVRLLTNYRNLHRWQKKTSVYYEAFWIKVKVRVD